MYMCGGNHLYAEHDTIICVAWLIWHILTTTQHSTWTILKHINPSVDPTPIYAWHNPFTCVTWLTWRITRHCNTRQIIFNILIHVFIRLLRIFPTAHSYVWHDKYDAFSRRCNTTYETFWNIWIALLIQLLYVYVHYFLIIFSYPMYLLTRAPNMRKETHAKYVKESTESYLHENRPTRENYKRDLQKRPTKETYKRDSQKRPIR